MTLPKKWHCRASTSECHKFKQCLLLFFVQMQTVVVTMGNSPFDLAKILYQLITPPIIFIDKGILDALATIYEMV